MTFKPVQKHRTPYGKARILPFPSETNVVDPNCLSVVHCLLQQANQTFRRLIMSSPFAFSIPSQCCTCIREHAQTPLLTISYIWCLFIYLFEYWSEMSHSWACWRASLTWWTWVWVGSGSWWWTVKPGMLQSMGLQRVGHEWVTELNWTDLLSIHSSKSRKKGCLPALRKLIQWGHGPLNSACFRHSCPHGSLILQLLIPWRKAGILPVHFTWCWRWNFNEYSGLFSFRIDWFDLLAAQGTLKGPSPTPQFRSISSLVLSFL